MGSGNERGNELRCLESWTVPPPWKLYFSPWRSSIYRVDKISLCDLDLWLWIPFQ